MPMALREARIWGARERLFERALPRISGPMATRLVGAASECDGVLKGLRHPQWPVEPWDALRRLVRAKVPLTGAADHGVSEALYLNDPDGSGVELYWDRPKEKWPRNADGSLAMYTRALDLKNLLAENESTPI